MAIHHKIVDKKTLLMESHENNWIVSNALNAPYSLIV